MVIMQECGCSVQEYRGYGDVGHCSAAGMAAIN